MCTLLQNSYCYTHGICVHMQNVRANVKVLKFQSFCIFSCIYILLCQLRSMAAHRDHFVRHLSVRLSGFLVVTHSYVLQGTHAFLGMLPLCYIIFIEPLTTKAHSSYTSGDCGTSSSYDIKIRHNNCRNALRYNNVYQILSM